MSGVTWCDRTGRHRYIEASQRRLAWILRAKSPRFSLAEIGELLDASESRSTGDILDAAHAKLTQVEADLREREALCCRLTRLIRACAGGERGCVALQVEALQVPGAADFGPFPDVGRTADLGRAADCPASPCPADGVGEARR